MRLQFLQVLEILFRCCFGILVTQMVTLRAVLCSMHTMLYKDHDVIFLMLDIQQFLDAKSEKHRGACQFFVALLLKCSKL